MVNNAVGVDRVFNALGDSTRRSILERLGDGPVSVSTLASPLDMSLAAVLQHLRVLEDCGLVSTKKVGRVRTCSLEPDALTTARDWLTARRRSWEAQFDRLGAYLATGPAHDNGEAI